MCPFRVKAAMKIDLNLFTVFNAIYTEGSLTRAAKQLNLTQPAISHALSRLRERLDDPLFERHGHKMRPTPLAQSILPDIQAALKQLNLAVQQAHVFEPQSAERTFHLAMRDVIEATVISPVVSALFEQAPNVQLASVHMERKEMEAKLMTGEIDFAVDVLLPCPNSIKQQKLLDDELVVVANKHIWGKQGGKQRAINEDNYLQAKHIVVSGRATGPSLVDYALNPLGLSRNIALRCQHYFAACQVVESTAMLLTMPKRYALTLCERFDDLQMFTLPFDTQSIDVYLYWHQSLDKDAANIWFRDFLNSLIEEKSL